MDLLDLARWFAAIGTAVTALAFPVAGIWWFADYDGFNRRFGSLPDAAQVIMSYFLLFPVATRALEGDHWAAGALALFGCFGGIVLVIRLRRRATA
ncbi:MAG: hypothetical protein K2Y20_04775 [Sphingomonas sp.]|nr:hypothetical protein [Sphingomonas sp.]